MILDYQHIKHILHIVYFESVTYKRLKQIIKPIAMYKSSSTHILALLLNKTTQAFNTCDNLQLHFNKLYEKSTLARFRSHEKSLCVWM